MNLEKIQKLPGQLDLLERYKRPGVKAVSKLVELHQNYPDTPETATIYQFPGSPEDLVG